MRLIENDFERHFICHFRCWFFFPSSTLQSCNSFTSICGSVSLLFWLKICRSICISSARKTIQENIQRDRSCYLKFYSSQKMHRNHKAHCINHLFISSLVRFEFSYVSNTILSHAIAPIYHVLPILRSIQHKEEEAVAAAAGEESIFRGNIKSKDSSNMMWSINILSVIRKWMTWTGENHRHAQHTSNFFLSFLQFFCGTLFIAFIL